jgi:hypothetical protein
MDRAQCRPTRKSRIWLATALLFFAVTTEVHMARERNELQQEIVDALLDSKAFNFEAIGAILAGYGERAAKSGSEIAVRIGRNVVNYCIPPEPFDEAILREERA